jgi:hypothetical protein
MIHQTFRSLSRAPGLSIAAIVTLALDGGVVRSAGVPPAEHAASRRPQASRLHIQPPRTAALP